MSDPVKRGVERRDACTEHDNRSIDGYGSRALRKGELLGALAMLVSCGLPAEPAAVRAHVVMAGACALDTSADQLAEPAPIDVDGLLSVEESGECAARTYAAAQDTPAASFQER